MDRNQLEEEIDAVVKMCRDKGLDQFDAFKVALFYSMQRHDMGEFDDIEELWNQTSEMAKKIGFETKFGEICPN